MKNANKRMDLLVARYCREEPMTDAERAEVEAHLMNEESEIVSFDPSAPMTLELVEPPRRQAHGPRCQRN